MNLISVHGMGNEKTNEKRNKERSHNDKERISRDAVKIMLKKCHGGCHLALVSHCVICNMLSFIHSTLNIVFIREITKSQAIYFYPKGIFTQVIYLKKRRDKLNQESSRRRILTTRFSRRNTTRLWLT